MQRGLSGNVFISRPHEEENVEAKKPGNLIFHYNFASKFGNTYALHTVRVER